MRIVLIDCENLTGRHQLAAGFRWRGFERIEIFGRAADLARWRRALAGWGCVPAVETVIADDAPPQAADQAIGRRVDALLVDRPDLVVISSNDGDFDPDIARLVAAGIPASRAGDPGPAALLALVVADLAVDGWADAGPVGERLARDFAVSLKGRLPALAAKAGVAMTRGATGRVQLAQLRTYFRKP